MIFVCGVKMRNLYLSERPPTCVFLVSLVLMCHHLKIYVVFKLCHVCKGIGL